MSAGPPSARGPRASRRNLDQRRILTAVFANGHRLASQRARNPGFGFPRIPGRKEVRTMQRPFQERRARPRLPLKWPVSVHSERYQQPVTADLLNVSCNGAYCVSSTRFQCGDLVEVDLPLPLGLDASERGLRLWCLGRVIRTEEIQPGQFGFACTFEDYTFLAERPDLERALRAKVRVQS